MATTPIQPTSSPIYGDALDDVFQQLASSLTGIVGALVRPRWQTEPANLPDFSTNWVALGVTTESPDKFAYQRHDPALNSGLGANILQRDEILRVAHSFYGPASQAMVNLYSDNLQIEQNRWVLIPFGIGFTDVSDIVTAPALIKDKWVRRYDVTATFRRRISRTYPVHSLDGASLVLDNEQYLTNLTIENP